MPHGINCPQGKGLGHEAENSKCPPWAMWAIGQGEKRPGNEDFPQHAKVAQSASLGVAISCLLLLAQPEK